jgi:hypothetical protein
VIHTPCAVDQIYISQKEAAASNEEEIYKKIPKSTVIRELNEGSLMKWQSEWDKTTKGQITKRQRDK